MNLEEFRNLCKDAFSTITDKHGKKSLKWFPSGCEQCPEENAENCRDNCLWPQNAWKWAEVKWIYRVTQAALGGMNISEIESLTMVDFIKVSIMKEFL